MYGVLETPARSWLAGIFGVGHGGSRWWENNHRVGAARASDLPMSGVGHGDVDLFGGSPAGRTVNSGPGVRAVKSEISGEHNLGGGARGGDVTLEMEGGGHLSER